MASHLIRIDDGSGTTLAVGAGDTILDAALAQGVEFPFFCRSGICRTCACDLLAGEVDLLPYAGFALTDDERAGGRILACRAQPRSDCTIAFADDRERVQHPVRALAATLTSLAFPVPDVALLRFALPQGTPGTPGTQATAGTHATPGAPGAAFYFSPGQYVRLALAGAPPADFSIASLPGEPELAFHVRIVPGDPTGAYIARRLAVGEPAVIQGPFGNAFFRERHTGPLLLAASGTGLAPLFAILRAALARGGARPITLYAAARDESDLYLRDELDALAARHRHLRLRYVVAEPLVAAIARDAPELAGAKAYVAGPPAAVEAVSALLREHGLPRRDLHAEPFFR